MGDEILVSLGLRENTIWWKRISKERNAKEWEMFGEMKSVENSVWKWVSDLKINVQKLRSHKSFVRKGKQVQKGLSLKWKKSERGRVKSKVYDVLKLWSFRVWESVQNAWIGCLVVKCKLWLLFSSLAPHGQKCSSPNSSHLAPLQPIKSPLD